MTAQRSATPHPVTINIRSALVCNPETSAPQFSSCCLCVHAFLTPHTHETGRWQSLMQVCVLSSAAIRLQAELDAWGRQ